MGAQSSGFGVQQKIKHFTTLPFYCNFNTFPNFPQSEYYKLYEYVYFYFYFCL